MATPVPADTRRDRPAVWLLVGVALLVLLWAGRNELARQAAYWFGGADARIAMHYAALSSTMDEAALQRHLAGVTLRCADQGDARICDADLAQADGVAAAQLRATLRQGWLQQTEVFVPWWAHHAAARALTAQLGGPTSFDPQPPASGIPRQIRWVLPQGQVSIARDPGWNPWAWSVLRWTAGPR